MSGPHSGPRKVALAGGMWIAGSKTCFVPVDTPDGEGYWEEVPVVTCCKCKQLAPSSPCQDCTVEEPETEEDTFTCVVCGGPYNGKIVGLNASKTCSNLCSRLRARTHYR